MTKVNPNSLSDEELLAIIKEEYNAIKPKGCHDFFRRRVNTPSRTYLRKRFGITYNELLIKAGIPKEELNSVRNKSLDEILDKDNYLNKLQQLANELGRTPTVVEYRKKGYSYHNLTLLFGTYNQALMEAGLKPNFEPKPNKKISKKVLLTIYKNLSQTLNRPATINDLKKFCKEYRLSDFLHTFGGMYELKKEAGFIEKNKTKKKQYTKEELIDLLITEYEKCKKHLTAREINQNANLPLHFTILNYFKAGSISDVWAEIDNILVERKILEKQNNKQTRQSNIQYRENIGEKNVSHQLNFLNPKYYKVYNNIYLGIDNLVQQIDHLVIGTNGIFHLETKNYKGTISIDRHGNWERSFNGVIEQIDNPEGQILRHEEILNRIINSKYEVVSLLVFSHPKCLFKNIDRTTLNVLKVERVLPYIKAYQSSLKKINVSEVCNIIENHLVNPHRTAI
ncbi:NERD domain-containing protein [Schinkia azotoformans]|uniref:NERD domain-containing protein n=1 Tax=Schinkia azotoformans TaxID=1454 RepID=UPI002DBE64B6|nr:NERD domain-containing protein [Schinkia azotoformans]MEC1748074.1 NERD domain-containing protein [Schinkia azotoformans]